MNRTASIFLLSLGLGGCASLFTSTSSEFTPPAPEAITERLDHAPKGGNGKVDHYAVLIGANTELRHRGNLSMAYQVLLEQGYEAENVFVFDSEGTTPFFPLTDVTTRESIEMMFEHLANVVETQDTLLVYITGHGNRITAEQSENGETSEIGVSTLMLNPAEEVTQAEFVALIQPIQPEVGILFFDQCYWGTPKSKRMCNYVTISTAEEDETSAGVSFPRAFWRSFREAPPGTVVSVLDAFRYAMVKDPATRMGFHKPRIAHGCVNPSVLTILGKRKQESAPDEDPSHIARKDEAEK